MNHHMSPAPLVTSWRPTPANIPGTEAVKAIAVVNRATGERLTVELEIGQSLWLLNDQGAVERVERSQLPAERWQILAADPGDCWDGGVALRQGDME